MEAHNRMTNDELLKSFHYWSLIKADCEYNTLQFRFGGFETGQVFENRENLFAAENNLKSIKMIADKRGLTLSL